MPASNNSRSSRWLRFFVAGALAFGLGAAVNADDVATATTPATSTGRIDGRIKLPQPPVVKTDDAALKALVAKSTQVRLHSLSLLVPNARDPVAEIQPDAEGRFVFEGVPAGRVRLRPNFVIESSEQAEALGFSFSLGPVFSPHTYVRSGETTDVAFFGEGRPVSGTVSLPPGIKHENADVRLSMIAPPARAQHGPTGKDRTFVAAAYALVEPHGELKGTTDADGKFQIAGVREGTYRIIVGVPGSSQRLMFDSVAKPGQEHVEYGKFDVPLMQSGTSTKPLDLGTLKFKVVPT